MKRLVLLLCLVSAPALAQVQSFDGVTLTGVVGGGETGAGCVTVPGGCQICGLVSGPEVEIICPGSGYVGIVPSVVINGGVSVKSGEVPIIVGYFGVAPPLVPYTLDGGLSIDAGINLDGGWLADAGLVGSQVACEWVSLGFDKAGYGDAGFAADSGYAVNPACVWNATYTDAGTVPLVATSLTNAFIKATGNETAIGNAWCCGQHATP
jgi:hypothetical protein